MSGRARLEEGMHEFYLTDGKEFTELLVKNMFLAINGRSSEFKKAFVEGFFKEHRYLQGEMFQMFYNLCLEIDNKAKDKEKWFDGRNEWIIKFAQKTIY
jgi:hypothetical protein